LQDLSRPVELDVALADLTKRLTQRFEHELPEGVVAETVGRSAEELRDARVTDFVPLFVERRSVWRLRALAAEVPGD
jgi:hypothetical protein